MLHLLVRKARAHTRALDFPEPLGPMNLNGRLFETLLNTTMRGKDLGQYFTPRSVVKLGVKLARLRADRENSTVRSMHVAVQVAS